MEYPHIIDILVINDDSDEITL